MSQTNTTGRNGRKQRRIITAQLDDAAKLTSGTTIAATAALIQRRKRLAKIRRALVGLMVAYADELDGDTDLEPEPDEQDADFEIATD